MLDGDIIVSSFTCNSSAVCFIDIRQFVSIKLALNMTAVHEQITLTFPVEIKIPQPCWDKLFLIVSQCYSAALHLNSFKYILKALYFQDQCNLK